MLTDDMTTTEIVVAWLNGWMTDHEAMTRLATLTLGG